MYASIYFDEFNYGIFFCLHHNVVSLIFNVKGAYGCFLQGLS